MAQEAFSFTSVQESGDAQDTRAQEVQRAALGLERKDFVPVGEAETLELRLDTGQEVWLDLECGRGEDCMAAEQCVQGEESEVQQGTRSEEQEEDKEGLGEELQAQAQFVLWTEGLLQVVPWQGTWAGEEVFPDLQVGRQEEVVSEELRLEAQAPGDPQGSDHQEEGWMEEQLIAGEQLVLQGEGKCTMEAVEQVGEVEPQSKAKAKPEEEHPVQQEQAQSGPGAKLTWSPLEVLQALQLEMEPVNEQASRAYSRLRCRTRQRLQPYFEQRSVNIRRIPGFWLTAFVNHPELSAMISVQDENMLGHMIDLKVREVRHPWGYCTISLCFRSNPYFRNHVIVKEYLITLTGYRLSRATPIQWYQHCELEAYSHMYQDSSTSFFYWFSDHSLAASGRIAEIISKDLWLNPLKYYEGTMDPGERTRRVSANLPHADA